MHQAAIDLFQLLIQAGAVPGTDFSCDADQQAYRLNERCHHLLAEAYPDIDWQQVLGVPYENVERHIAALHQQLGCPFVDTLIERMVVRLSTLPDREAAGYLQGILVGVESATGLALYPFLAGQWDMAGQLRLEWLLRQEDIVIPGSICLLDLLLAAGGGEDDCEIDQGEILLTEHGWQRLSYVWNGECTLSPPTVQP